MRVPVLRIIDQREERFLQIHQVLLHPGTVFKAGLFALKLFDASISRIVRLAPAGLRLKAPGALFAQRLAPTGQLRTIQTFSAQSRALLAAGQIIVFGQQALLPDTGELSSRTPLQRRLRGDFVGLVVHVIVLPFSALLLYRKRFGYCRVQS